MYDLPVEMVAHDIPSDNENENDKSVYEAHLSSNLQNVSLTMNEKEGKKSKFARLFYFIFNIPRRKLKLSGTQ